MAGIASNMHLSIRELGIDVFGHGDHMASDLLGRLFITSEIALDMTEVALLSQRSRERAHSRNQIFVSGQQLQILWRRMLRERSHCEKQCREG